MSNWLIDIELLAVYAVLLIAVAFTAWSVIRTFRLRDKSQEVVNNIPVTRIGYATALLLVICLILTFLTGSSEPVQPVMNDQPTTSTFWLKTADMFIYTSLILILIAVGGVIYGMSGMSRKAGNERGKDVPTKEA